MIYALKAGPLSVNTYIVPVSSKKVFVVDPADSAVSGDAGVLIDFLKKHDFSLEAILLTHGHFDHVAGLSALKEAFPAAPVLIHEADSTFLGKDSEMQRLSIESTGFMALKKPLSLLPKADYLLSDGMNLGSIPLLESLSAWRILHTPGHTAGSSCFYSEKDNVLISGDTLFYGSWGRTDLPSGSEKDMQKSLRFIFSAIPPNTMVYPGHDRYGFTLQNSAL